jgi:hypothetical protein
LESLPAALVGVAVPFLTRVSDVLGSNPGQDSGHSDRFLVRFLSPFEKLSEWQLDYSTSASFQIHHSNLYEGEGADKSLAL